MTSQRTFLARMLRGLEEAEIPYMVSGSLGSSVHGEPRATNDIDIIIAPSMNQLESFINSLGSEYYVSAEAAHDAFRSRTMFNVIDRGSGWKADLNGNLI